MKILMLNANQGKYPYPVLPLGIAYVYEALRTEGHEVKVLDLCFSDDFEQEVIKNLKEFSPQVIQTLIII